MSKNRESELVQDLVSSKKSLKHFSELFVTDLEGKILYSTHTERVGQLETRREGLRALEDGKARYLDGPYWDDLTLKLGPSSSTFHDGITLMYSQPLVYEERVVGVLMGRLPNDVQSDIIQREDAHIYKGSGDTYIFMVKSTTGLPPGVALSRSRFEDDSVVPGDNLKDGVPTSDWGIVRVKDATELDLSFKDPATGALTEGVRRIIDTGESVDVSPRGYFDYRHVPVIGVGGTIELPGSPDKWGLVAEADVAEAYSGVIIASETFAKLALVTSVLACVLIGVVVIRPMNALRALMARVQAASDATHSASSSLARSAKSLSGSAADQAGAIAETVASMEEITAMVTRDSESAQEALSLTRESANAAADGSRVVAEMSEAMNSIANQNSELAMVVEIIENISDKTKVINDIVFETKLLSFNASIEAARAGEQGKGFAVVAEEVGNLARLSGKAAQEIHSLIDQSTKQVQTMVSVTKESIAEGIAVTERCRATFESISGGVNRVASMMDAIALSANEQQQGISQVSRAMAQMDKLTQNTATAASDVEGQSNGLRNAGGALHNVVHDLQLLIGGSTDSEGQGDSVLGGGGGGFGSGASTMEPSTNDGDYDAEEAGMKEVPDADSMAFG